MLHFAATGVRTSRETGVRRITGVMLVALVAARSTLGAQTTAENGDHPVPAPSKPTKPRPHAIAFGFVATLGANWQMEAGEVGYVRRPSRGLAAIGFSGRAGTFIDESSMLGGNKGVVFGATLSARTRMKSIAQLGAEEPGTGIGFDLTFELSGYTASNSPMTLGSHWVGVSVLPAFSVGSGDSPHFAIVLGPTAFFTAGKPVMRGFLALRGEAPLARKERHP